MILDPHIHLLPGLGDGPASENEAAQMLETLEKSGVCAAVVVTHADLSKMQDRTVFPAHVRDAVRSLKRLQKSMNSHVKLVFSYEIDYEPGLFTGFDMKEYRIPGTDLLPVNFPLGNFDDTDAVEFSYLIHRQHLRPLICQFERHILMPGNAKEKLLGIFSAEYLISSTSLLLRPVNDVLQRAALDQRTFYLATNAHNATTRAPLISPEDMRISGPFQLALYKRLLQSNASLYRKIVK